MKIRIGNGLAALACVMLTACGGGGGGDGGDPNGGLTPGGGSGGSGTGAPTSPIPTSDLPPGPPSDGNSTYTCRDVKVGAVVLDTVFVPAGATCALGGTRLIGTAQVDRGAFLDAVDVDIDGNVQAQGAGHVAVSGRSTVGGSIQLEQGQSATLRGVQVTGDIQLTDNLGPLVVEQNLVGANIQIKQNRGGVTLNANRANGNIECQANQPPPTGSGNVAPLKTDQCRNL